MLSLYEPMAESGMVVRLVKAARAVSNRSFRATTPTTAERVLFLVEDVSDLGETTMGDCAHQSATSSLLKH